MKSAGLFLGALATQCPLQVTKCESHTVSENLSDRINMNVAMSMGYEEQEWQKFRGLTGDYLFRSNDQIAWDIQCPEKYNKVPFAVATSNGLYVRFMKERNSKWQVAKMQISKFNSLDCKHLNKLRPQKLAVLKRKFKGSVKRCSGYNWILFKGNNDKFLKKCTVFSAKTFLLPDTQFAEDMADGKIDTLISVSSEVYEGIQFSVSSLNAQQRERLSMARVAVFKCGEHQGFAWRDLVENEPEQVLVRSEVTERWDKETAKSFTMLKKVHWDDRCEQDFSKMS